MEVITKYKQLEKMCADRAYNVSMKSEKNSSGVIHFSEIIITYKGLSVHYKVSGENPVAVSLEAIQAAVDDIYKWEKWEKLFKDY